MGRKNENLLDLLTESPWWVSVLLATVVYVLAKWVLPEIQFENIYIESMANALPQFAHIFAFVLLIPAPFSLFNSIRKKKLLEKQQGVDSLKELSWKEFEELVAEMFRRKGYVVYENATLGSDGGIDLTLNKDGSLFLVQCKNWRSSKVGVKVIREMYGVMVANQAQGVIIITSGFFTQDAKLFSDGKPIELIEGQELIGLIKNVQRTHNIEETESGSSYVANCPRCGSELVMRKARRGSNAGKEFWGCSSFPNCKFTKSI